MALNIKGDRSLYWSTGLDLNGLKSGAAGAKGILGKLTANVSAMDVFAGVGASAAIAFGNAAKKAYSFSKDFQTAMKEVETISIAVQKNYDGISKQIVNLSKQVTDSSVELTKAYYETVSSGYDGAAGLELVTVAAKAAMGGVTETKVAVDGLTTVLNAFKIDASRASEVSDIMFKTVELGKTTFEELAAQMSTVASIAAANKIEFIEVSSAIATMTKQGVPTAEAMTQIRSAILSMNEVLGDGWSKAMTLQEGMQKMADVAGGSNTKLRELTGRVEAMNAVLALSGDNLKMANDDLEAHRNSLGATERAYQTMKDTADSQLALLGNNIAAKLKPIGDSIVGFVQGMAGSLNKVLDGSKNQFDALTKSMNDYLDTMQDRRDVIADLIDTIEELASKTEITKEESENLIIAEEQLSVLIPQVEAAMRSGASATDVLRIAKTNMLAVDKDILDIQKEIVKWQIESAKFEKEKYDLGKDDTIKQERELENRLDYLEKGLTTRADAMAKTFIGAASQGLVQRETVVKKYATELGETVDSFESEWKKMRDEGKSLDEIAAVYRERLSKTDSNYLETQTKLSMAIQERALQERKLNLEIQQRETELKNLENVTGKLDETTKKTAKTGTWTMPTKTEESAAVIAAPQKSDFAAWIDEFKTFNEQSLQIDMEYISKRQAVSEKYSGDERDRAMAMLETERQMAQEKIKIKKQEYENFSVISENEKAIKEWTKAFQTFAEQRLAIEEDFNNKARALREKYDGEQEIAALQQLETERQLQLDRLAEQENNYKKVQELDEETGKILEKNLNKLSVSELKNLKSKLSEKQKIYKNNTDSYLAITGKIEKINEKIWDKEIERIREVGRVINALSDFVGKFDSEIGDAIGKVGELVDDSANLVKNLSSGNYIGATADALNIITSLIDKTETALTNYKSVIDSTNTSLQRQYELMSKLSGMDKAAAIKQLMENALKEIAKLEETIKTLENTYNAMVATGAKQFDGGRKALNEIADLIIEYNGMLTDAKDLFEQLTKEYEQALTGAELGTFIDDFVNRITEGFQNGLNKTEDFAKSFQEIMRDMFVNTFKQRLISDFLDNFYKQWAESAKDGMTPEELTALNASFNEGIDNASAAWQAIVAQAKAAGIDLMNEVDSETATASKNSLKGAIQGITEDTASLLAGQFNAIRINVIGILRNMQAMQTTGIKVSNLNDYNKQQVINFDALLSLLNRINDYSMNSMSRLTDLANNGIKVKNFNQTGFEIFENIVMKQNPILQSISNSASYSARLAEDQVNLLAQIATNTSHIKDVRTITAAIHRTLINMKNTDNNTFLRSQGA